MAYTVRELSLRTFPDFETLAIKQGGCWCMFYQRSKPVGRGATSDQWKRINRRDKRTFVRNGRAARDERGSHEENDPPATLKETLIEGPGYSASRAGRSAGRSLSWHGRGRGFKSHPVHFIRKVTPRAESSLFTEVRELHAK